MALSGLSVWLGIELLRPEQVGPVVLLYVGPDQILPLASVLGAIVGIILICWRYVVGLAGRIRQFLARR